MLTIQVPNNFLPERKYIIDMLFHEFLGLEYDIAVMDTNGFYEITLENTNTLIVKDHFFGRFREGDDYLDEKEVPSKVKYVESRFAPGKDIPVIFGSEELKVEKNKIVCGIDIFASSFFMLTRWEEYADKSRDSHGRFPALASLAYRNGFLDRAVVNEYSEMLWNMLRFLKSGQERKKRAFRTFVTHDVDAPFFYANKDLLIALKRMKYDIFGRNGPVSALNNFSDWVRVKNGQIERDRYYTFDYIMDVSERFSLKSNFLFITDCSDPARDGDYSFNHKLVRRLLVNIHRRGHDIGLHLSYGSFKDPSQTQKEFDILRKVCAEEGIKQDCWTSRHHFLRWATPASFNNLESAHLDYDSTLSYADVTGFRCGVCYEYPAFDIIARKQLFLRERPLLVMECTVIDERYMNLGAGEKAFGAIKGIKDTCRRFNGDFTVLWHNTRFVDHQERQLYNQMLQA